MALVNRLLGLLLGLALAFAGGLLAAEAVVAALGRPALLIDREGTASTLGGLGWGDTLVTAVLVALIVVGALLLIGQLVPRMPDALPLRSERFRSAEIDRKALGSRLSTVAIADGEVIAVKTRVGRRKAKVRAKAQPGAEVQQVRKRLMQAEDEALAALELAKGFRTKVSVRRVRERSS